MTIRSCARISAATLLFLSTACATPYGTLYQSAHTSYANSNYDQAVQDLAKALRLKPDYNEAATFIREVEPKAVESHLDKINEAKASAAEFKWDRVVAEYTSLIAVNDAVKSLPSGVSIPTQDYSRAVGDAKAAAAEAHYQAGRRLFGTAGMTSRDLAAEQFRLAGSYVPGYKDGSALAAEGYYQEGEFLVKQSGVEAQKQAAKAFAAAQQAMPGYKDAATAYQRARKAGVKRLAIIPFEDRSGKAGRFGDVSATVVDGVVSSVMRDAQAMEFLEIVPRDQTERVIAEQRLGSTSMFDQKTVAKIGQLLGVHEMLTGEITQIIVTPEQTTSSLVKQAAQVCDRTERVVDSKGKASNRCVYDTVVALATLYDRKASVEISGSYKIVDVKTGALKETQQFGGAYRFATQWGTYEGDQRALSGDPQRLVTVKEEHAPVTEDMVNRAAADLTRKLSTALEAYAR